MVFQKKNSQNPEYYGNRGLFHLDLNNLDAAVSDFRKQLQLDKSNKNGWYFLIGTLFRLGKFDEAINGKNISIANFEKNLSEYSDNAPSPPNELTIRKY